MRKTLSVPREAANCSANGHRASAWATRSTFALPWPSGSGVPEPLDLKWLTTTANAVGVVLPGRLERLGERLARVRERGAPGEDHDAPTGATSAGL